MVYTYNYATTREPQKVWYAWSKENKIKNENKTQTSVTPASTLLWRRQGRFFVKKYYGGGNERKSVSITFVFTGPETSSRRKELIF